MPVSVLLENIAPTISCVASVPITSLVKAIVPAVAGKVTVGLPLKLPCAGA